MDAVKDYKCLCCGAPLIFDGSSNKLRCESCDSEFELEALNCFENAKNETKESKYDWDNYVPRDYTEEEAVNLAEYSCSSCGAKITGDDSSGAAVCPYCGNSTIVKEQFSGNLRPDYVIPFKTDKDGAIAIYEEVCSKLPFLPDEFRKKSILNEMMGVYVPFWMFDCDCMADIIYDAKRIHTWSDSDYNYTKTDFYKLIRSGSIGFANIPADGSQKADDTFMEAIEPYDYSEAVDFNTAYLAGFFADKYDVSADECRPRANERVKNSTEAVFARTTEGYSGVLPEKSSVRFSGGKIRYALLPVWMLNIKYNNETYNYAINGQTGKVAGKFPVCKKKRNRYFFKVFAITLAVIVVIMFLLGMF